MEFTVSIGLRISPWVALTAFAPIVGATCVWFLRRRVAELNAHLHLNYAPKRPKKISSPDEKQNP